MNQSETTAHLPDADGLARFLGVGRGTIDELRKSGRIPFVRIGPKTIRFDPQAVVDALRAQQKHEVDQPADGAA